MQIIEDLLKRELLKYHRGTNPRNRAFKAPGVTNKLHGTTSQSSLKIFHPTSDNDLELLKALSGGVLRSANSTDFGEIVGQLVEFGRPFGEWLSVFLLGENGRIIGNHNPNESNWTLTDRALEVSGADGRCTTRFDTILAHRESMWLLGVFEDGSTLHYLTKLRHVTQS